METQPGEIKGFKPWSWLVAGSSEAHVCHAQQAGLCGVLLAVAPLLQWEHCRLDRLTL